MKTIIGAVLLAAGAVFLVWGINASDSVASEISEFFTGQPTDRSMWLIVGGAACAVAGLVALLLPRARHSSSGA
jgi:hypothetical protein